MGDDDMKKENYERTQLELIEFEEKDVITTSTEYELEREMLYND